LLKNKLARLVAEIELGSSSSISKRSVVYLILEFGLAAQLLFFVLSTLPFTHAERTSLASRSYSALYL